MRLTSRDASSRSIVVIMAKEPVPAKVKTRLGPQIEPVEAARLYALFVEDVTAEMAMLAHTNGDEGPSATVALAHDPEGAQAAFEALCPASMPLLAQTGAGLGQRMARIFERFFAQGFDQVLVIGSDIPDLPRELIGQALERLDDRQTDVVIGPCPDGGYFLIGLKRPRPELFAAIPWSTSRVLETTLQTARRLGLAVDLLDPWADIDTYADLQRFVERHKDRSDQGRGPGWRTLKYLRDRPVDRHRR